MLRMGPTRCNISAPTWWKTEKDRCVEFAGSAEQSKNYSRFEFDRTVTRSPAPVQNFSTNSFSALFRINTDPALANRDVCGSRSQSLGTDEADALRRPLPIRTPLREAQFGRILR